MKMRTRQRPAAVLILALLLMGAIIGSTISLSTVIGDSNHQTTALNNFISSSIAADSGLERSLAVVKQGRIASTLSDTLSAAGLNDAQIGTTIVDANVTQSNTGDTLYVPKLLPGQSVSVDLLNYQSGTLTASNATPNQLTIQVDPYSSQDAYTRTHSASSGVAAVDISWIALDNSGNSLYNGRPSSILTPGSFWQSTSPTVYTLIPRQIQLQTTLRDQSGNIPTNLGTIKGYRIRFSAPNTPVGNTVDSYTLSKLTVTSSCNPDPSPTVCGSNFPSRLTLQSTATAGSSQAQKSASVLWQLAASPVFNYVLFTEGDIIPE